MKIIKITAIAVALVLPLITVLMIIHGKDMGGQAPLNDSSSMTLMDGAGRRVKIDRPVKRIVCASPDIGEIVKILHAESLVVGVDTFIGKEKTLFPGMSNLPVVGVHGKPDLEKILQLETDVLLVNSSIQWVGGFDKLIEALEPEVSVVCLNFIDQKEFVHNFTILQKILNKEDEGNEFLDFYTGTLSAVKSITSSIPEVKRPRVYWEMYAKWQTFGKHLGMYQFQVENAGGRNISKNLPGMMVEVDREWLIESNPEIILKIAYPDAGYPGVPRTLCGYEVNDSSAMARLSASIKQRGPLAGLSAVKTNRICIMNYELMESPRNFVGVVYMAKWFYPERFRELNPEKLHQRYLSDFLGIDYDLSKKGVFAWPDCF